MEIKNFAAKYGYTILEDATESVNVQWLSIFGRNGNMDFDFRIVTVDGGANYQVRDSLVELENGQGFTVNKLKEYFKQNQVC